MILSGREIKRRMQKDIVIEPFEESQLNPNSYNLRLHDELLVYDQDRLDMKKPNTATSMQIQEEGLWLETGRLFLGRTV
ncbi:MAG: dCTP deaminase, partial [Fimbriimonadaceae bacterium]